MKPILTLHCIVCGEERFRHLFRKSDADFFRCLGCGLVQVYPLPTIEELQGYYDHEYTADMGMGTALVMQEEVARATAQGRLSVVLGHKPGQHWLDVGCADGMFVNELRKAGFLAEGIDFSRKAIERACNGTLNLRVGTLERHSSENLYDVITGFDIIEHLLDPMSFLKSAFSLLAPGGLLVLTTPDTDSMFCRLMRRRWSLYIPILHLFYFNQQNLGALLTRCGFAHVHISKSYKDLNFDYSLIQFQAYNPLIYRLLSVFRPAIPASWRRRHLRFYIGEMMLVARKPENPEVERVNNAVVEKETVVC